MDSARMELAKNILGVIIPDAISIVIFYAELTEMEKLSIVFTNACKTGDVEILFDEFPVRTSYGPWKYDFMWILLKKYSLNKNGYRIYINFGNNYEMYHTQSIILEDLLPSRCLNICIVPADRHIIQILNKCRNHCVYKMKKFIDEI